MKEFILKPIGMPDPAKARPTQLDRIEAMLIQLTTKKKPAKARGAKKNQYTVEFEAIWLDYPSTYGANKKQAYAAYCKRVLEATMPSERVKTIHSAVKQYAKFIEATGRYVKLPATFFGPSASPSQ